MRCPSESELDDVLDRVAPPALARELRRHVAECPRCLERHGASFELELWSEAIGAAVSVPAPALGTAIRVAPWWSLARRVAAVAAAVVIGGAGLWTRGRFAPTPTAETPVASAEAPWLTVYSLEFAQGRCGPDGSEQRTARLDPLTRNSIDYTEVRRDASGFEHRSRRTALLRAPALLKESP